ncbi:MAG: hypothetical protein AAGA69_10615 [Pseudomonadota bacterium]
MRPLRRAILRTLDAIDDDELVLGLLLLMRDEEMARAIKEFANAHPADQQLMLRTMRDTSSTLPISANENDPEGD